MLQFVGGVAPHPRRGGIGRAQTAARVDKQHRIGDRVDNRLRERGIEICRHARSLSAVCKSRAGRGGAAKRVWHVLLCFIVLPREFFRVSPARSDYGSKRTVKFTTGLL